ncbi:MAG: caspase family protein, partial [Spirochaetales bacterium]|nr:caspase family protein [Spirochaetales bacterium]
SLRAFAAPMEVKRFGIFIGANDGGRGRQRLLYAGDDAAKMAETMTAIGGIADSDSVLLLNPTAYEIKRELSRIGDRISSVQNFARRTEVMFYYSGHSDESGIMIKEEMISYREIRDSLSSAGADVIIAILDSCSSGAITRLKGGQRRSPFLIDDSSSMEGHAFLTSSSASELSQESDSIAASFFTHYLISGLRGAADTTGDGRVTLNEIYQHTFDETLSRTESTIGGPQHPAYEIQLTGTGDLVLTDLTVPTSALQLSGELEGRFSVRNSSDRLVAEFSKPPGDLLKLALPAGEYTIRMSENRQAAGSNGEYQSASVSLNRNAQLYLTRSHFSFLNAEYTRFRGEREEEEEDYGPGMAVFTPWPGINMPELTEGDKVSFQGGLVGTNAPKLEGAQIAPIWNVTGKDAVGAQLSLGFNKVEGSLDGIQWAYYGVNMIEGDLRGIQAGAILNMTDGPVQGIQGSGIFNMAGGRVEGVQGSGIFNMADGEVFGVQGAGIFNMADGALKGVQGAGIFNMSGMPSGGVQGAGLFNIAGELHGVQAAGLFNHSRYMKGVQAAPLNIAGTMNGLQVGLINVAKEMRGVPVGLINISRNGVVDFGGWYEYSDDYRMYLSFQSGTNHLYTMFYWGNTFSGYFENPDNMAWGVHIGSRIPFGFLEFDIDAGFKQSYRDLKDSSSFTAVPSARAIVAMKGIGIFWGATMDFKVPGWNDSSLHTGPSVDFGSGGEVLGFYNFIFGIRI